jgi:non-heme chloroperoxidase
VITYDARGSGASDRPVDGYGFGAHAGDGVAVLDELAVDHAGVVTASMGVNAAVIAQVEHPGRIDRLAAIAPYVEVAHLPDDAGEWASPEQNGGRNWFSEETWRTDWPGFARFFMQACFTEPGSAALIDELVDIALDASPEALITQRRELDWTIAPSLLSKMTCPTLFIHGDSDITWPVSAVRAIADLVPDVRLDILPGAAHRPDIQAPERVNETLAGFLLD